MPDVKSPYDQIGGDQAVKRLCHLFYQIMSDTPQTVLIRSLHPSNIKNSEQKLYQFLSGWLGGPTLYTDKYGHPRLRARHLPFAIGVAERDQWLYCMAHALKKMDLDHLFIEQLMRSFAQTADFMRNSDHEVAKQR